MSARTFRQRVEEARSKLAKEVARRARKAAEDRGFSDASELVELAKDDPGLRDELRKEILESAPDEEARAVGRELGSRREAALLAARRAAADLGIEGSLASGSDRELLLERIEEAAYSADPRQAARAGLVDWLGSVSPDQVADLHLTGKISDREFDRYLRNEPEEVAIEPVERKPLESMTVEELSDLMDEQAREAERR